MKKTIIKLVKWLWQAPQHILALLLGLLLWPFITKKGMYNNSVLWECSLFSASMSLGEYIFLTTRASQKVIKHEGGHSKQSLVLGPLYLIVIGLPSIVHNIIHRIFSKGDRQWDYYSFWSERWLMDK